MISFMELDFKKVCPSTKNCKNTLMEDEKEKYTNHERSPQRNHPKKLRVNSMFVNEVENANCTD